MRLRIIAALAAFSVALVGCGGGSGGGTTTLRIMAPASPGGGWDQTSRTAEQALKSVAPDRGVEVFNVPGAAAARSGWPSSPVSRATATC
ncbi:hypothetical protein ACFSTC_07260 [Nonomuraea ferruginea]